MTIDMGLINQGMNDIEYIYFPGWENRNIEEDTSGYLKKGYRSDILEPLVMKFVDSIYHNWKKYLCV